MRGAADQARFAGARLNVRARLVLLVLAFLIPGLLLTGFLLWDLQGAGRQVQERQLMATARALSLVVDRQIGEQAATLQVLATAPSLKRGDWPSFYAQAREAMRDENSWVVVRARNGPMRLNTRLPLDAAIKGPPAAVGPEFWAGERDGASVSNLFNGALVRQPVIVVRRSVVMEDGGVVDVSVITRASSFAQVFRDQRLPGAWTGTILDARGRVVARSRGGEHYVGKMASAETLRHLRSGKGVISVRTLDGIPSYAGFDKLDAYKWSVFVAVPADEVIGPARRSLIAWLGIGVLLLAAAVVLAVRVASGVATPVEQLARAASDWVDGQDVQIPSPSGLPETDSLAIAFAAALAAVDARDAQQTLLINELNHRVKNTLATVQSIALHSRRANASADEFHAAFEGRLLAMSAAHDILTRTSWEGASLEDIISSALRPFLGPRLVMAGPPVQIGPTTALNLSLILYELATNAAKYGALSGDTGQVDLAWTLVGERIQVNWTESGGPPITNTSRKGFGSRLIERAARDLQPATLEFESAGVRCMLTIDMASQDIMRVFQDLG